MLKLPPQWAHLGGTTEPLPANYASWASVGTPAPETVDAVEAWMRRKHGATTLARAADKLAVATKRNQRGANLRLSDLKDLIAMASDV